MRSLERRKESISSSLQSELCSILLGLLSGSTEGEIRFPWCGGVQFLLLKLEMKTKMENSKSKYKCSIRPKILMFSLCDRDTVKESLPATLSENDYKTLSQIKTTI